MNLTQLKNDIKEDNEIQEQGYGIVTTTEAMDRNKTRKQVVEAMDYDISFLHNSKVIGEKQFKVWNEIKELLGVQ